MWSLDIPSLKWQVLLVLLTLILLRYALRLLVGIDPGWFDPFTFSWRRLKFRDALEIDAIKFHPMQRRLLIRGLNFKSGVSADRTDARMDSTADAAELDIERLKDRILGVFNRQIVPFSRTRVIDLLRLFQMHINDIDINLNEHRILAEMLFVIVRSDKNTDRLLVEIHTRGAHYDDIKVCSDFSFITSVSVLDFKGISIDFNAGSITLPMRSIYGPLTGQYDGEVETKSSSVSDEVPNNTAGYQDKPIVCEIPKQQAGNEGQTEPLQPESAHDSQAVVLKIVQTLEMLVRLSDSLKQVNITVEKLKVLDFPVTTNKHLRSLNNFLNFDATVSNFTFNISRFTQDMPGFQLFFIEGDTPLKISMTLSRLIVGLKIMEKEKESSELVQRHARFLEFPNISIFGETNLISQSFTQGVTDLATLNLVRGPVLNLKAHVLSPTLDVDILRFSLVKSFMHNISVFTDSFKNASSFYCGKAPSVKISNGASELPPIFSRLSFISNNKDIFNSVLRLLIPLLNIKLTLEDFQIVVKDADNLISLKMSTLMLRFKSNISLVKTAMKEERIYFETIKSISALNLSVRHTTVNNDYAADILTIDSVKGLELVKLRPTILVTVTNAFNNIKLDLSELPTLVMLNKLVRKVDSQILDVEETYFRQFYEKFASMIKSTEDRCSLICKEREADAEHLISPREFLFLSLPEIIDYFKMDINDLEIVLGARSVFMPPEVFPSVHSQSSHDLVDGSLRKFSIHLGRLECTLFGLNTQWRCRTSNSGRVSLVKLDDMSNDFRDYISQPSLDNISTSQSSEESTYPWYSVTLITGIECAIVGDTPSSPNVLTKRTVSRHSVITVNIFPDLNRYAAQNSSKIQVIINRRRVRNQFSLGNLFLTLSGIHTLNQIFRNEMLTSNGMSRQQLQKQSLAKQYFLAVSRARGKSRLKRVDWKQLKDLVFISFTTGYVGHVLSLPNGLTAKTEAVNLTVVYEDLSNIRLFGEHFRVCVASPTEKGMWERLLLVNQFNISVDVVRLKQQLGESFDAINLEKPSVTLRSELCHITVPYNFHLYRLIDNFSTVFKSLKQMIYSFRTSKNDSIIFPKMVRSPSIPKVRINTKRYIFSVADDPLEAQLNMIFQIGLQEQKSRLAKWRTFNENFPSPHPESNVFGKEDISEIINWKRLGLASVSNLTREGISQDSFSFINAPLEQAYDRLERNISTSWIRRVQTCRARGSGEFLKDFKFLWGNINFSLLPPDINKHLKPFTSYPFLTNVILENTDITLSKPSFGTEGVPKFIHETGKGSPMDTKYSILLPVHIDAKFSELRWHLRDYPLPFIYVPPLPPTLSGVPDAIHIHGNMAIAEDLVQSDREIRGIYVPLVPSITIVNTDRYYSLLVPRTVTAVKLYMDLQCEIKSKETTFIAFGNSYQPSIQQTMQCLDNISKPPTDRSPKVGFWDKLRYMVHGKFKISWVNNGRFEIHLKGSRSPYKLGDTSAGYSLGFGGNVQLGCNETGDPKKFLRCTAERIDFFTPNFFAKPFIVWSKPSSDTVFVPNQTDVNLQEFASFYYLLDLEKKTTELADTRKMRPSFFEKIAIQLTGGIEFDLGMTFERLKVGTRNDRTFESVPHYATKLCNPAYVENLETHDSYAGFRSQFIHMSFRLVSSSKDAYNTMQLSPMSLDVFFKWWKSFQGNYPVRRGKLYDEQTRSPKFGEHLFTISYTADVEPLFISHVCHNVDMGRFARTSHLEKVEFAGLKSKVSRFILDLHQRREVLTQHNYILGRTKRVKKLKFNEGDLVVYDIDVRIMHGLFEKLHYEEQRGKASFNISDNDKSWIDVSDFQETFFVDVGQYVPKIDINPLLFSPQFIYQKRASHGDKYQLDPETLERIEPFQNSVSHDCLMGTTVQVPEHIVEARVKSLEVYKGELAKKLDSANDESARKHFKVLLREADATLSRVAGLSEDLSYVYSRKNLGASSEKHNYCMPVIKLLEKCGTFAESFDNRYFVFNMLLKVTPTIRDVLFKYKHYLNLSHEFISLASGRTLSDFERLMRSRLSMDWEPGMRKVFELNSKNKCDMKFEASLGEREYIASLMELFETGISNLQTNLKHAVSNNHLVQFIMPQIQFTCAHNRDMCTMVTSPGIMMKFVSFEQKEYEHLYSLGTFMKRTGIIINNANVFFLRRSMLKNREGLYFDSNTYGKTKGISWAPWLGIEYNFQWELLESEGVIKNLSTLVVLQNILPFSSIYELVRDSLKDKTVVYLPKVDVTLSSDKYQRISEMVTSLLTYKEPEDGELRHRIEKMSMGYDMSNIKSFYRLIRKLYVNQAILLSIERSLSFRKALLDYADQTDLMNIFSERRNHLMKLYMLKKILEDNGEWRNKKSENARVLHIRSKEVNIQLKNNDETPFLDILAEDIGYEREILPTGFNKNDVTIQSLRINNRENENYRELLAPYRPSDSNLCLMSTHHERKLKSQGTITRVSFSNGIPLQGEGEERRQPLCNVVWNMEKPVGGIKIVNNVETQLSSLAVKIDDATVHKILEWFAVNNPLGKNSKSTKSGPTTDNTSTAVVPTAASTLSTRRSTESGGYNRKALSINGNGDNFDNDDNEDAIDEDDDSLCELLLKDTVDEGMEAFELQDITFHRGTNYMQTIDVDEMMQRSSSYVLVDDLLLNSFVLSISYKGKGKRRLINVTDFIFQFPRLAFTNQTLTVRDIFKILEKVLLRVLLMHTGRFLGNKIRSTKRLKNVGQGMLSHNNQIEAPRGEPRPEA